MLPPCISEDAKTLLQSYQDYIYSIDANFIYSQNHPTRNKLRQKTKSFIKSHDCHRADEQTGMRIRNVLSYSVHSTSAEFEFCKETIGHLLEKGNPSRRFHFLRGALFFLMPPFAVIVHDFSFSELLHESAKNTSGWFSSV